MIYPSPCFPFKRSLLEAIVHGETYSWEDFFSVAPRLLLDSWIAGKSSDAISPDDQVFVSAQFQTHFFCGSRECIKLTILESLLIYDLRFEKHQAVDIAVF